MNNLSAAGAPLAWVTYAYGSAVPSGTVVTIVDRFARFTTLTARNAASSTEIRLGIDLPELRQDLRPDLRLADHHTLHWCGGIMSASTTSGTASPISSTTRFASTFTARSSVNWFGSGTSFSTTSTSPSPFG